jgi:hypothetical protein
MTTLRTKSIYLWNQARIALLGLAALSGAASPLFGQDMVAGKFTLTENTHFGNKVLPAGTYKFSVENAASIQTISSISGAEQPVLVILRPETNAVPVTSIFAMASRSTHPIDSSKLVLERVSDGMAMQSMYLDRQKLKLNFEWTGAKDKTPTFTAASQPAPAPVPTSKATD